MAKNGMFSRVFVEIEGIAPLIMHNGQLANPRNQWAQKMKDITKDKKRKDTDEGIMELSRLEYMGGLYIDDNGPYIPDTWIEKNIRDGAASFKEGKTVLSGLQMEEGKAYLAYDGPKTGDGLFADERFVDVRGVRIGGKSRVMRTRPIFPVGWRASFVLSVVPSAINVSSVRKYLDQAAFFVGLGDYRPKFGRYEVVRFEELKDE